MACRLSWPEIFVFIYQETHKLENISVVEQVAKSYNCNFYQNFIVLNTIFSRTFLLKKNPDQKPDQG